jgi:hypothetical protein
MLAVSFSTFAPEEKLPECQQLIFCDNGNGSAHNLVSSLAKECPGKSNSRRGPACASTNVVAKAPEPWRCRASMVQAEHLRRQHLPHKNNRG